MVQEFITLHHANPVVFYTGASYLYIAIGTIIVGISERLNLWNCNGNDPASFFMGVFWPATVVIVPIIFSLGWLYNLTQEIGK